MAWIICARLQVCLIENYLPVIEIVEELIELVPLLEAWLFRDNFVVGRVETGPESPKHSGYSEIILVVTVEAVRVEHN